MTAVAHPSDAAPEDETPSVGDPAAAAAEGAGERSPTRQGVALIARFVRMHERPNARNAGWDWPRGDKPSPAVEVSPNANAVEQVTRAESSIC